MRVRPVLVCVGLAAALALTGCKASADQEAAPAAAAQEAPISAEALCAHLKKEAPRIIAVGSEVGAMAQLSISIANLYDDHLDQLDGSVVDEQALKTCPDVRAQLTKAAGIKSLAEL
ncbi:hypothetical protein BJ973_006702 [Actinoplanes tereljensis]|uniref:Lipoprotein n=1 Tax=Paractinoplanes tereljensis TaxID=571912 RepID=A0A919NJJ4_9ACTN|nr:hypothetical protein [Actinoplanes tereljensis]GIF19658.1 hypothetical protein Ate02nite_23880 [Actinoplanes tereljensis]